MSKIDKCPFCGNSDKRVGIRRQGNKGYRVICGKCGASGPYVAIKDWHDNKMIAQEQAIKGWNTRKPMEWIVERLEVMFKHHSATKTVQRLVLETVKDYADDAN